MAKNYKLSEEEKEKARKILERTIPKQNNTETEKIGQKENNRESGGYKPTLYGRSGNIKSSLLSEEGVSLSPKEMRTLLGDTRERNAIIRRSYKQKASNPLEYTPTDFEALKEAEEINKRIQNGGPDAVLATIENAGRTFAGGVEQGITGIENAFLIPTATMLKNTSNMAKRFGFANKENGLDRAANSILDVAENKTDRASYSNKINSRIDNDTTKTIGNVTNVIGNMVPAMVSNVVAPGSGLVVTGVSSGGNSAQETINEDRSNLNQATLTGIAKGIIESATEKITGGNILSKGSLDDFVGKTISSKVKSNIGKNIVNKIYQFGGEMLEEQISDNAGYLIDKVINNKDLPDFEEWWNNAGETNKITFLSTLALNLVGLGGSNVENVDAETQQMVNKVAEKANNDPEMQRMIQSTVNNINNERNTNNQTENNMLPTARNVVSNNVDNNNSNNLKEEVRNIIENSKVSDNEKSQMLEVLDNMKEVKDADIEAIRQTVNIARQVDIENNKLDTKGNYQNDATRRQKYAQYKNDTSDYDNTVVEQVLDTYPTNRNGKRTVKQWMKVAQDIGTNIADKSNAEIEKIAYKSWFDIEPSKNITQYDSQEKQNVSFQKLTSDEWINEINRAVNETRQQSNETNIANNLESLYNGNESESGLNGSEQYRQRTSRILGELETRLQQEQEPQQSKNYTREEYEQWEKSIEPITESKLTNEQKQLKDNIKRQYGKDIVFFDGQNAGYQGGSSLSNSSNIYINKNQANEFGINRIALHEVLESNIAHNLDLKEDIINPTIKTILNDQNFQEQKNHFWEGQEGNIPSDYAIAKDIICDRFSELKSGEKLDYENVLSHETNMTIDFAIENFEKQLNNKKPDNEILENASNSDLKISGNKILNPTEISNLKSNDASTTPKLQNKNYAKGNKQSSFFSNITEKSKFLNEDFRDAMKQDENIEYYKTVSNKETLEKAYNKLQEDGQEEVMKWHSKDSKKATSEDVAEGWILLKQYQDAGDYDSAVEVAKKMRDIGTTAGQTVQAYNILSRLTPEGMFYYAQGELSEAYSKMVEGKSKKWIDENRGNFDLTPEETQFILDTMQDVSKMEDGYQKKVKLAEIQKIITDKIPATTGQSIKAWMRISMLFNPKTQVRNVMGNAVITPVNMFSDSVSAGIDRLISKKTGIRTTGNLKIKSYGKGFGKGLYESYNDFKKGINTRNIEGNRFEVSEGRSFNNKGLGKALNRVDNLLSFMLDAGDRGFYEATFTNSINNQLVLNKTNEVTQDMIDIATSEALQRTWQDNNNYTKAVLGIRKILNNVNIKGYGLGDVLIPFAKTPANLTKAIVDYSPVGLVKTLGSDAIKLKNSLENGQYTPQLQHKFVQNLGKATAGTFLYVLGYALAQAGVITGEADEDKDVKNFMKNSLGINSYSIKIGNKSFSYDWAQPIATPFAIMANYVKYSKDNPEASAIDKAINAMNIGTEQLLEQSFMESLNTVLNGNGTTLENLSQAVLELPSRAVPTFSKQIADMVDSTQRTSFEYGKPIQSAINSIVAKIPGASKTLAPSVDTLGNEIKKYGGDNNFFNVFINPANMNKGELSKAGEEIYNLYKETGDTTIFPRTAPYYINDKNEKVTMTAKERSEFQKISGSYVENTLAGLLNNKDYKKLSDEEKVKLINEIVSDSYSKAKYEVLKLDSKEYQKLRKTLKTVKTTNYYDYKFKTEGLKTDKEKMKVLSNAKYTEKEKTVLYETYILSDSDTKYPIIKETFASKGLNMTKYLKYKTQEFESDKEDDGTVDGKSISGSKKKKVMKYIDSIEGASYTQKLILTGLEYSLSDHEKSQIVNYIDSLDKTNEEKLDILSNFKGFTIYKDGTFDY